MLLDELFKLRYDECGFLFMEVVECDKFGLYFYIIFRLNY